MGGNDKNLLYFFTREVGALNTYPQTRKEIKELQKIIATCPEVGSAWFGQRSKSCFCRWRGGGGGGNSVSLFY